MPLDHVYTKSIRSSLADLVFDFAPVAMGQTGRGRCDTIFAWTMMASPARAALALALACAAAGSASAARDWRMLDQ